MSRTTSTIIASLAISMSACGVAVQSGRFSEQPLPPATGEVTIYSTKLPSCDYDEIGLVRVLRKSGWTKMQAVVDALRESAREMGGNAVVGVTFDPKTDSSVTADGKVSISTVHALTGTVVRLKGSGCGAP